MLASRSTRQQERSSEEVESERDKESVRQPRPLSCSVLVLELALKVRYQPRVKCNVAYEH